MELHNTKSSTSKIHTENVNSFHHVMSSVLITAQCFGVMPVSGITAPSAKQLRFRWWSIRTVFCMIVTLGAFLNLTFSFMIMKSGISFEQSDNIVFFGCVTAMYMLFLQLARKWPNLVIQWENLELSQRRYGYPKFLNRKVKLITAIILVGALVEHVLSKASGIIVAAKCTDNLYDLLCHYFTKRGTYNQIFVVMNYNVISASLTFISNFISTFLWNFTDLFIILVSISLTERFHLYNKYLVTVQGKILPESFWAQVREEYNCLSFLTRHLDSCISKIVLVSYGNNLYFICRQLLNSLSPIDGIIDMLYFCWSFGFLLLRTVMLSLYAASIYEESKQPRIILYSVPSECFTTEVKRLLFQITTDTLALTGMNFFYITRTLLLTLAGTIVTYEIVLKELNKITIR
ncbi:hypothetical protein L9F63_009015, partial [Diploptera punctata]